MPNLKLTKPYQKVYDKKLAELRKAFTKKRITLGISHMRLSKEIGVTDSGLWDFENRKNNPSAQVFLAIEHWVNNQNGVFLTPVEETRAYNKRLVEDAISEAESESQP